MEYRSIPEMFFARAEEHAGKMCLRYKRDDQWRTMTWSELADKTRKTSAGLLALGIGTGDIVGILAENRPEWAMADLGTVSLGAADAPIYPTNLADQITYILNDCAAKVCFVSTKDQLDKVIEARPNVPSLKDIVIFDDIPKEGRPEGVITLAELFERGAGHEDAEGLEARIGAVEPESLLTLIYTSGTTGPPKGVMLSHRNILTNVEGTYDVMKDILGTHEESLSFLPMSHSFERTIGYYTALYHARGVINYAESIPKLVANFGELRPTLAASVPRIYEKIYEGVKEIRSSKPPIMQRLIDWAMATGTDYVRYLEDRRPVPALARLKYALAYRIIFRKIYDGLGGRVKFMASGGGPLSAEIARFMRAAGIQVYEGYGLTETSPVLTTNRPDEWRFGSVGKPIKGVEIKIAEDGEILAHGPNIMMGYYNKPDDTAEVIDKEGWFHTGDVGEIDSDGFLKITDRKKDIIVTAGGKNIAPQNIENHLKLCRHIETACVVGDRRKYITALIVPNFEVLRKIAAEKGWGADTPEALVAHKEVMGLIDADIKAVNAELPRYETIKKFRLLSTPFSEEDGTLTPTMKVKRRVVDKRYTELIDEMYE